jgi:hypothetical protein
MNAGSTTVWFTFSTERGADDEGETVHLRSGAPANKVLHLTGPAWRSTGPPGSRSRPTTPGTPTGSCHPRGDPHADAVDQHVALVALLRRRRVDQDRPEAGLRWHAGSERCDRRCGV